MSIQPNRTNLATLLFFVICGASSLCAQSNSKPELTSIVVLKNSNILEGVVRASYDNTIVETANGSRLVIGTDQIGTICGNFSEAYDFLRSQVQDDDFAALANLFSWTLRYNQLDRAQVLIDELQFTKINPQQLDLLNRRLMTALAQQKSDVAKRPPEKTALPVVSSDVQKTRLGPSNRNAKNNVVDTLVQPATFQAKANNSKDASEPTPPETTVSVIELEKVLQQIPNLGKQSFKQVIEPVLLKNCANAGCHHRSETLMPLFELGKGITVPRRMSQQNLYQVMRFVGDGTAESSPLLKAATQAHGTTKKPPIEPGSREHVLLCEWLTLMAEPVQAAKVPQFLMPDKAASNATPDRIPGSNKVKPENDNAIPMEGSMPIENGPMIPNLNPSVGKPKSEDPYDPEIFNRLYLKKETNYQRRNLEK